MGEANLLSALSVILKNLIGLIFTTSKLMAIFKTRIRRMETQIRRMRWTWRILRTRRIWWIRWIQRIRLIQWIWQSEKFSRLNG